MGYLLRAGEGKAVAIYTRCEDELLCRAEVLLMLEDAPKVFPDFEGHPVWAFYDVDPTYTIEEFKQGYVGKKKRYRRLMQLRDKIIREGWSFPLIDEDVTKTGRIP